MGEKERLDLNRFKKKVVEQKVPKAPVTDGIMYVQNVHCHYCTSVGVRSDQMLVAYSDKQVILTCSNCGRLVVQFTRV